MQIYHDCAGRTTRSGATEIHDKLARIFGQPNCETRSSSFSDATESNNNIWINFGWLNPMTRIGQLISDDRRLRQAWQKASDDRNHKHHVMQSRTTEATDKRDKKFGRSNPRTSFMQPMSDDRDLKQEESYSRLQPNPTTTPATEAWTFPFNTSHKSQ